MSWELQATLPIELTPKEKQQAILLRYDLAKLLLVKQKLVAGENPTLIYKCTGISRNTIYNYKKILCLEYTKSTTKDSQSTREYKSVLYIFLINNSVQDESTFLYWLFAILVIMAVGEQLHRDKRRAKAAQKAAHDEEVKVLRKHFYKVLDLTYKRVPIIVGSDRKKAYYNKLLAHYKNSGREVLLLVQERGEPNDVYFHRKETYKRKYIRMNQEEVRAGRAAHTEEFNKINSRGLLAYFKNAEAIESKAFLHSYTEYLAANPAPVSPINTSRKLEWDNSTNTIQS